MIIGSSHNQFQDNRASYDDSANEHDVSSTLHRSALFAYCIIIPTYIPRLDLKSEWETYSEKNNIVTNDEQELGSTVCSASSFDRL